MMLTHWITRDGATLEVGKMDLSHIVNCLRMRLRQFNKLCQEINSDVADFVDDFGFDGDMATATGLCNDEYAQLKKYESDVEMFVEELKRRGYVVTDDGKVEISLV